MANCYDTISAYAPSSDPKIDIKEPLERIVCRIINAWGSDSYSQQATLILLFSHIDSLGDLLSGGSPNSEQAKCAVEFIRSYLGRVDKRYKEAGGLLYYMLRHGLIHKSFAKRLRLGDNSILGFKFSHTKNRKDHLIVIKSSEELRLKFNITLFYEDLLAAIDLYCDDMSQDKLLRGKYDTAWGKREEPEDEAYLRKCKYIEYSDWDFINNQISSFLASSD